MSPEDAKFVNALDRSIDHYRAPGYPDPHGISLALWVALLEVRNAFAESRGGNARVFK